MTLKRVHSTKYLDVIIRVRKCFYFQSIKEYFTLVIKYLIIVQSILTYYGLWSSFVGSGYNNILEPLNALQIILIRIILNFTKLRMSTYLILIHFRQFCFIITLCSRSYQIIIIIICLLYRRFH